MDRAWLTCHGQARCGQAPWVPELLDWSSCPFSQVYKRRWLVGLMEVLVLHAALSSDPRVRPSRTVLAWLDRNKKICVWVKSGPITAGMPALKQVAKALPTVLHVAVSKEHVAKTSSAKKPLLPAKWKAVGKAFATYQHDSRQRRCTSLWDDGAHSVCLLPRGSRQRLFLIFL